MSSESTQAVESESTDGSISWKEFLETASPSTTRQIDNLIVIKDGSAIVAEPTLELHCTTPSCNGVRFFSASSSDIYINEKGWKFCYLTYACNNCETFQKTFALAVRRVERSYSGHAYKFGELPAFGPPTPSRVITLIGPDRDTFLRGRRAENLGFGVGAFAYYRRVVEDQKSRIITEIGKVAQKLGASVEDLKRFDEAAKETQFSKAIDDVKGAIPSVLLIEGHNPLKLLHTALSDGIHAKDDAHCLELAQSIRLVLVELAERMSEVLKNQTELKGAISKLLGAKKS
jgi:hypothetical protein